jgi:hypothetical protein
MGLGRRLINQVRTAQGGISGFVIKNVADLVLVDSNFANPIVLGTVGAPIGVAAALAEGTTQGYPTGQLYTEDGIGGASLLAVDATSNQVLATIGTLPVSTATALSGTFRGSADTGFLEASNPVSTQDPATRDLYLLNSQTSNSLIRAIGNL